MANLVKPWIVRWVDAEGRRVAANTPGATKTETRAKKWYAQHVPGWPSNKRVPLATHKATAHAMLNRLVEQAVRGQAGLLDRYAGARRIPLSEHLEDFERRLKAEGKTSARQVKQVTGRVREIFDGCGWREWADLTADNAPDQ